MTSRQPSVSIPPQRDPLVGAALLGVALVYVRALAFTPIEARQGAAQKIMASPSSTQRMRTGMGVPSGRSPKRSVGGAMRS